MNSSPRILYFKERLWIFQFFCSGLYGILHYIMSNASYYMEGKETNFNNHQKLIEVKFIFTTWPH